MVLPQHTEELSLNAKNFFVLMEKTSSCMFQPTKGGKGRVDLNIISFESKSN